MKRIVKRLISFVLVLSMLFGTCVSALAAKGELYLSELRLVYANTYKEAKEILAKTDFKDYNILNENLNDGSGNTGVWLAYKTTDDIEDAITDMSIIQMCGGYKLGNYQEFIKESYEEYKKMGDIYLQAIDYFNKAYDAGHFLAKSAHRQLNFYNVVSKDVPESEIPDFEGERLGDIFYEGVDRSELATMFFEGNYYVLQNVRSLLAMGVSYNADGKTYLQKVADEAAKVNAGEDLYKSDYDEIAVLVAPSIISIKDMFKELEAYEEDLNYMDDEFTQEELDLAENKVIADMMRDVIYLDGKTLYEFCYNYESNSGDYSELYPLISALNEGQLAMTKVAHYYDVIRYSMTYYSEEHVLSELDALEEKYEETPFNIYEGVDRTVYSGSFAITTEAYRADVYGEGGISDALFGGDRWEQTAWNITVGAIGIGVFVGAIVRRGSENTAALPAIQAAEKATAAVRSAVENVATQNVSQIGYPVTLTLQSGTTIQVQTFGDVIDTILSSHYWISEKGLATYSAFEKYELLMNHFDSLTGAESAAVKQLSGRLENVGAFKNYKTYKATLDAGHASHFASSILFIAGAAMILYSVYKTVMTVYNYYNPEYEDVPLSMVDLIETVDGDRYIKYDAVLEAEPRKEDQYIAGDLNGYQGQRWNALYYTKSYEAGKPLLADEFYCSSTNNKPKTNYAPVHRFGEVVCYDMNKYNFNDDTSVYLSVKQSKNNKAAVTGVPEVVGSIFANGLWLVFGGLGAAVGVLGTLGTQTLLKKKREQNDS